MKDFTVSFSLSDSEYLTAVRLVVGAICSASDEDIDATEDFKVCVTESCIILKNCGFENAVITFKADGGVGAEVEGFGGAPSDADNEFSLALVSALVSECNIERKNGVIGKVILKI